MIFLFIYKLALGRQQRRQLHYHVNESLEGT